MAGFDVVDNPVRTIWVPVDYNNATPQTVYQGQLVSLGATDSCSGVKAWAIAGAGDTTTDHTPFGVVVGTNNRTPLFSSTYKGEYIASVRTQAAQVARDYTGAEGKQFPKNDPQALVQVAVIGPNTILKGRIFNAAYGTAPTVAIASAVAGSGDGTGITCAATGFDFTAVAYNATYCGRSGLNMGISRVGYDTNAGTGAKTFYGPNFPYTCAVGDTWVGVNLALGTCKGMFDSLSTYINCAAALTSDYVWLDVLELNLAVAGDEYAIFRFNPLQFLGVRA
jgi:hypothetical protein